MVETYQDDVCRILASRKPSLQIQNVLSETKMVLLYSYMNTMNKGDVQYADDTGGFLDRILLLLLLFSFSAMVTTF